MSRGSATIRDIANMLGISKSTVSRALNNRYDVSSETSLKVRELANQMDYYPNLIAQHLKQKRTNSIGVVIPETVNRFFAKAVGGIQEVANRAGYNVMICQSNESLNLEKNNLQTLLASRVDGILISVSRETNEHDHLRHALDREIPVVFFDRIVEELSASQVYSDNFDISFQGTEHLINQGCKRIAFIAGPQHLYNSRNRLNGYLAALQKYKITVNESLIVDSNYKVNDVEDYTRYLFNLQKKPDGIFALNDMSAVEIMYILKKKGLRIPKDVAVLGFNNETICKFVEPSLSSIDHPAFDMGAAAAEILLRQITKNEIHQEKRMIKSSLVVRESTQRKP
ncbi:MAG TPA: LacI family DNA-binding transcriptional regulator [Cyclobacteriaceae bacterium]|nr:LacI family DNA-binding transcriptional regulator [Cyclobacteriaceae bacterium]